MKKLLSLVLGIQILSGFFATTQAVDYQDFPQKSCNSVEVIYLQPKDGSKNPALFELQKRERGSDPFILLLTAEQLGDEGFEYRESETIQSGEVLKRFKFFNKDGTPDYKKYCVGFQEAIPIGAQGEVSKSIGADSGVDLIKNYVSMIYKFGSMFIGLVAVLVIVVSGIQMTTGGIDSGAFESAKTRILAALLSLVLLFSSAMILKTINPGFFT